MCDASGAWQELSKLGTAMDELARQRRTLMQTGFNQQAGDVQQQLRKLRETADAKRREVEQKLYKQRLWMLELSQKHEVMRAQSHCPCLSRQVCDSHAMATLAASSLLLSVRHLGPSLAA